MSPGKTEKAKQKQAETASAAQKPEPTGEGNVSCELQVPTVSDVVFKYTWKIRKYNRTLAKNDSTLDSPIFECSINGITTKWVIGIRCWRGPNGKRITNPVAVCVSLVSCSVGANSGFNTTERGSMESIPGTPGEQARLRFQLGVFDADIRHWELCPVSRVALHLANTTKMLSVGYKDMRIEDRHMDKDGDISLMVKLQLIPTEVERHTLSQDLGRLLEHEEEADTSIRCANCMNHTFKAHSNVLRARSSMLAAMLSDFSAVAPNETDLENNFKYHLDLTELSEEIVNELLRYIYTDKVENLDTHASKLLTLAHRFYLDGLTELCERSLVETLTPSNVGNVLLLADQCNCEPLKRAALAYCEENVTNTGNDSPIGKSSSFSQDDQSAMDLCLPSASEQ